MSGNGPARQIVALGGGGFSMEPENLLLDRYVLGLSPAARPKVCFVGTASGDSQDYIDRFYAAYTTLPCEPTHLALYRAPTADLASFVLAQDIVYVGGGNTRNLLALWREWGLDRVMRAAWRRGIILAGISAGSICWFDFGTTDSIPGDLTVLPCLGFLPGSNCPHYDGEAARRPSFHRFIAAGDMPGGYAADDGVALHFTGETLTRIVSSRPRARAFRVECGADGVTEAPLTPDYLGADAERGES